MRLLIRAISTICPSAKEGLFLISLLAEHTFRGTVDLTNGDVTVKRPQRRAITRVDAGYTAQGHDLRLSQLLGVDLVRAVEALTPTVQSPGGHLPGSTV
jgi:hypothetical protein